MSTNENGKRPRDVPESDDEDKEDYDEYWWTCHRNKVVPVDLHAFLEEKRGRETVQFAKRVARSIAETALELAKPMGVVFEENEPATGGVFIASFAEGGAAEADGTLQKGDQLVVVADTQVIGRDFDFCLDAIRASDTPKTR